MENAQPKRKHPRRKNPRLSGYDYSAPGTYFITICTQDRKPLLSRIVGGDVLIAPQVMLTKYGKTAEGQLCRMDVFYPHITVERYVIMPNHIPLLLRVNGDGPTGMSAPTSPRQHQAVADFVSTFKRFCSKTYGQAIWQRSYHDHIIRDEADYQRIARYIAENPAKWPEDCFYQP